VPARVALVTGGGRGLGRAIGFELARRGFDVAVGYRSDAAAAREAVDAIRGRGRRAAAIEGDVAEADGAEEVVRKAVAELGPINVLVSNAGWMASTPFLDVTAEELERQLATNAKGAFFAAQAAARQMIANRSGGKIVFITSKAGSRAVAGLSAYCVSKAATKMLTEAAALELAEHGITVNAVAPGTIETDLNRELLTDSRSRETLLWSILLDRPGQPQDVASAVAFLVSDEASFITGATLAVDGGSAIGPK
jgi:glucose 1-dehydrogenase